GGAGGEHDGGDVAANVGLVGGARGGGPAFAVVPGEEEGGGAAGVLGALQDRGQVSGQPLVTVGDRAIVHVVDQVRGDEGERGQFARGQVAGKPRVGHVNGGAAAELGEVWRRVMPD